MPHVAGAQEGVKAKNRQTCYSLSRALEKAGSKRPRSEAKGAQPQPAQQNGAAKQSTSHSTSAARLEPSKAAPQAQKAQPTLSAAKKQKLAAKAQKAQARSPGQSPDASIIKSLQQPSDTSSETVKLRSKSSPQHEDHAGPSSSTDRPQRAADLEVPASGSGKLGQKSSSSINNKDAARLVNAALNEHPGLSPSSAPPKLNGLPAGNGVSKKKLKKKHRLSLPSGKAQAADVPQRAAKSAQKHMPAGGGGSPQLPVLQGNGAASAGDTLTDSQRKKVRSSPAFILPALTRSDIPDGSGLELYSLLLSLADFAMRALHCRMDLF